MRERPWDDGEHSALLERLKQDQRQRWRERRPRTIEEYLREHPSLGKQTEALLVLIYNEVLLREEQGQTPSLSDYAPRFPHLAEELALQFQAHEALGPADSKGDTSSPEANMSASAPKGYEILGELGRGGMGVVYKARQVAVERIVALKMIRPEANTPAAQLARFGIEVKALGRLQHPNIVVIHEVGEYAGQPFFSMEFCEGGSLDKTLTGPPRPPREAARLVGTLARAMQAAHEANVIHRDLKPSNVLLLRDGTPKITDFGLAKRLDVAPGLTRTGEAFGTPPYMSPEQVRGHDVGVPTDVWALGVILYEVLTGRRPFQGRNWYELADKIQKEEPAAPTSINPSVPPALETICLRCLKKEPSERFASAAELAGALGGFFGEGRPSTSQSGEALLTILTNGLGQCVEHICFSPDGKRFAGSVGSELRLWDQATGRCLLSCDIPRICHIAFDSDGKQLHWVQAGNCGFRGGMGVVDAVTGRISRGFSWPDLGDPFLSSDGKRLAIHHGNGVWVYDTTAGQKIKELLFYKSRVWCSIEAVSLSPDGERLAGLGTEDTRFPGGSKERMVLGFWNPVTGRQLLTWRVPDYSFGPISFSPDGKRLGTVTRICDSAMECSASEVTLWDASTGHEFRTCQRVDCCIEHSCFSPDGKLLAGGGAGGANSGVVKVWDADTGYELLSFTGHSNSVSCVCFSPDGQRVASGGYDGTVKVWDISCLNDRPARLRRHRREAADSKERKNWFAEAFHLRHLIDAKEPDSEELKKRLQECEALYGPSLGSYIKRWFS